MRRTALAALLLTAWFPLSATAASVTVRSGETLSDIAYRYGVSIGTLMRMNGIRNPDNLQVGRRLQVPGPNLTTRSGSHHVKSGETLSDISYRYGVSIGTLMRMNGIRNPDNLQIGRRLQVPGPHVTTSSGSHRVKSGETLSTIASQYQVRSRDLIALNNLRNANHINVDQTLRLPGNAVMPRPAFKSIAVTPIPGATEHTVTKGQTLTQIAKAYKLPVASLISINALTDPNKVEVGTRLYLTDPSFQASITAQPQQAKTEPVATASTPVVTAKPTVQAKAKPVQTKAVQTDPVQAKKTVVKAKPVEAAKPQRTLAKSADWRTYGPLQVDWGNWQDMGGSQVVPTLNAQGQALYLAVNCPAKKINATGADGSWKTWEAPKNRFEKDLVKDRCQIKA
ncbi:LysM peptidoglycan-binding domain-containing protein [Synechococcus sp. MU1642]|uniref:LysM peptidoglycan-binding domain-containing protein n=1 Tax=Synechococcus sp. MU1642 TaxID=2508348 RepID=UPI001CF8E624|nr:LysM peptidoglycan-binding domain-containing protein [Synechococcus sp. MU1642]MCB4408285.1 LysM peptidoglycan-binding domain-containing protein [Synechococcus sp. MU1642]